MILVVSCVPTADFERAVKVTSGVVLPRAVTITLFTLFSSHHSPDDIAYSDLEALFALFTKRRPASATTSVPTSTVDALLDCVAK